MSRDIPTSTVLDGRRMDGKYSRELSLILFLGIFCTRTKNKDDVYKPFPSKTNQSRIRVFMFIFHPPLAIILSFTTDDDDNTHLYQKAFFQARLAKHSSGTLGTCTSIK